jgi:Protein of unknown function (DUF4019)
MTMKKCKMAVFGLLVLCLVGCGKQSPDAATFKSNLAAEQAASQSAQVWLDLMDAGSYAKSWAETAAVFKSAVNQADWEKTAQAVRAPLGRMVSRKIKSQQYASSLPGAPDGEYVVIQYATTFENKASAVETVTPMLDKDGQWKVSGYYIK